MSGPLAGIKIVEIVGLGPAPFCAMLLSDLGAEVIRVDRPGGGEIMSAVAPRFDTTARGRRSIALNLKKPGAAETVLDLVRRADGLIEGFRPGVMERLGLGPDACLLANPKLVYGRMTGWGQDGPLAKAVGHDINYIALAGVLSMIGKAGEPPVIPSNLIGDFGGGGMLLALGMLAALLETSRSGKGQVVDAAMVEGAALLNTMNWGFHAAGLWSNERGTNNNDGAAHYYNTYLCADGKYVSIGSVEPQFYATLRKVLNLVSPDFDAQHDPAAWPALKEELARIFKTKTSDEWCRLMEGQDVCFAPVLDFGDAPSHPHNVARRVFVEVDGVTQPAPAPRFSRTPAPAPRGASAAGSDTQDALLDWGISAERIEQMRAGGALG